jgi:hypothetical protein
VPVTKPPCDYDASPPRSPVGASPGAAVGSSNFS